MTEEMMTEDNEHAVVTINDLTIEELRVVAQKNTRWRKAIEYLMDDDYVIISSKKPDLSGWEVIPRMKTTWKQVKALAERVCEEE